jgi:hypothetical protein
VLKLLIIYNTPPLMSVTEGQHSPAMCGLRFSRVGAVVGKGAPLPRNCAARRHFSSQPEVRLIYPQFVVKLNGDDLRRDPLQVRKATLASVLAKASAPRRHREQAQGLRLPERSLPGLACEAVRRESEEAWSK